jgi:hypothetical protein
MVADDLPQEKENARSGDGELLAVLRNLRDEGLIHRYILLSSLHGDKQDISQKYFGARISKMRDHRGIPLLGWVAGIEAAQTDFVVHFDSDILVYQASSYNWLEAGMSLLERDPAAMFIAPLPGPPATDGQLRGQATDPSRDDEGNFRFKTFSSRRFLLSKLRFLNLLPTRVGYTSSKRAGLMRLGFGNAFVPWEECVSRSLQKSEYYRVHLRCPQAWTLHCPEHSEAWVRSLPDVISRVEKGQYPSEQAGYYDLIMPAWL